MLLGRAHNIRQAMRSVKADVLLCSVHAKASQLRVTDCMGNKQGFNGATNLPNQSEH